MLLRRDQHRLLVSFPYHPDLVALVKELPYAEFQKDTRMWSVAWCAQTVQAMAKWHRAGHIDADITTLLEPEEEPAPCHLGMLLPGPGKHSYQVWLAWRQAPQNREITKLGSRISKTNRYKFQSSAAGNLQQLVARGVLSDPHGLLVAGGDATIAFDVLSGGMQVAGDPRVDTAMARHWPKKDVVAAARNHGVDVRFLDAFTEQVYRSELAANGPGIQPDGISVPLFPYQKQAVAQVLERNGLGLFLSPGLGKTLIGIAAGLSLLNNNTIDRVVVCPPGSVRLQWQQEISRFTGCDEDDVVVIQGGPDKRAAAYAQAAERQWLVVHHEILSRDHQAIKKLVDGQMLIIDEAHRGSNYQAQRSKRMVEMAALSQRRLIMTGTPVQNEVREWYQVMGRLTIPGLFGGPKPFLERYAYPATFGGYEGARNLEELADRSRPHFIRWTKKEVATHLPPLQVKHTPIIPPADYQKALVAAHTKARDELSSTVYKHLEDEENPSDMTAVGMLRAMCSSPQLLHQSDSPAAKALIEAGLVPDVDGPKLDVLRKMTATLQEQGERVVVFTYSRTMANLIASRLAEDGIRHVEFHGETTMRDRDKAVAAFTTVTGKRGLHDDPTVFVATDAAAEGLNLGRECSTVINFDLPWVPGRLEQRSNRVHRVDGTHSSYLVVNLTLQGSVEHAILRQIQQKARIQDVLFGEKSATEVTGRALPTKHTIKAAIQSAPPSSTSSPHEMQQSTGGVYG